MAEEASIEVQINARVDKLDAGLKVAEAQVNKSAKVMGDAGDAAGKEFGENFSRAIKQIGVDNQKFNALFSKISDDIGSAGTAAGKEFGDNFSRAIAEMKTDRQKAFIAESESRPLPKYVIEQTDMFAAPTKAAEEKITGIQIFAETRMAFAAKKIGDSGAEAGDGFTNRMKRQMINGLALGALTNVIGGGILNAIKGINAGDSGKEIGVSIATGIVDGAKSIPVVGIVVSILDEAINGMDRIAQAAIKKAQSAGNAFWDTVEGINDQRRSAMESRGGRLATALAGDDPTKLRELTISNLETVKRKELADIDERLTKELQALGVSGISAAAYEDAVTAREKKAEQERARAILENDQIISLAKKKNAEDVAESNRLSDVEQFERNKKLVEEMAKDALAASATAEKTKEDALKAFAEEEKSVRLAAEQVIQDQIDALQAPTMIDKQRDEMNRAQSAAQGMIQSGITALGQFNFAQDGAANLALAVAKEQSKKLDELQKLHDTLKSIRAGVLV